MWIWCCGCKVLVQARLTTGAEIYPHRQDLRDLPFWRCDVCRNYVGCHHKTTNPTKPLGNIPTVELRAARMRIHAVIDPLWKSGTMKRKAIYARLSEQLGRKYHTADLRTLDEAKRMFEAALVLKGY
jgi:zinc-finger-containing domain